MWRFIVTISGGVAKSTQGGRLWHSHGEGRQGRSNSVVKNLSGPGKKRKLFRDQENQTEKHEERQTRGALKRITPPQNKHTLIPWLRALDVLLSVVLTVFMGTVAKMEEHFSSKTEL